MSTPDKTPLVSIIIVCHNDGKWLPRCLRSVREQTVFDRIEVIIADNASSDGSADMARELIADWPNANVLPTGGDNGFGVACNLASGASRGKYLYLLNPDTWLEPDCIERLCEVAENKGAGVVGGTVLNYDDTSIQAEGGTGFDFCGTPIVTTEKYRPEYLMCPGTFFFIRRDVFIRVGMMDKEFFMYGEEMDLAWRVWVSGEKIVSGLAARIHHQGAVNVAATDGATKSHNRTSSQKRFLANRNRLLMVAKNCQHIFLLMLAPCVCMVFVEGLITGVMTRNWTLAKATSWDAVKDFWRLRRHIREERRNIAAFRRRGDFWMLRFFRFGFGRSIEIAKVLKGGFPKFA